jgi:hypothetical protein
VTRPLEQLTQAERAKLVRRLERKLAKAKALDAPYTTRRCGPFPPGYEGADQDARRRRALFAHLKAIPGAYKNGRNWFVSREAYAAETTRRSYPATVSSSPSDDDLWTAPPANDVWTARAALGLPPPGGTR